MKINAFEIRYVSIVSLLCWFFISLVPFLCEANFKVEFRENRLYVDGKPFFMFGVDGVVRDLRSMRDRHVNAILSGIWTSAKIISEANKLGMMIIPCTYSLSWNEKMERLVREIEPKSAILAWNIGDDLGWKHLEKVKEVYKIIRKIDPNPYRPIMLDSYPNCAKEKGESRMG